jgi:DNA-directed RNA polymerase
LNGEKIVLNNPILFDASCNGLQHLSALTREVSIAVETNLIHLENSPQTKNDFYKYAASLGQGKLDESSFENIRNIKMNRKLIKKTVMTIPYNITEFGVKEQFRDMFEEYREGKKVFYKVGVLLAKLEFTKDGKVVYLFPSEVNTLGKIVYTGLLDNLPSLRTLSDYLDGILTIVLKLNLPII